MTANKKRPQYGGSVSPAQLSQMMTGKCAGLLTHEIVYEHLAKLGEEDSVKARRINRALYQQKIKKEEFWKLIKDLEIPIYP